MELANQKRGYTNTKAHITGIPGKEDQSKNTSRLTNQKKVKRKINHRAVCHNDYHLAPSEKKNREVHVISKESNSSSVNIRENISLISNEIYLKLIKFYIL